MDIIITLLTLVLALGIPISAIVFFIKRKSPSRGQIIGPIGPRQHDGILTFNEYRGIRSNVEVVDPRGTHNQRYQRRHASKQAKPAKPWMK